MAPKPTLTKSLHTVTAVANVAAHLRRTFKNEFRTVADANALTEAALEILGYNVADFAKSDDTVARCVAAVAKVLQS